MISLTGLLIQSYPSYTSVCPGDTVIFTCSSTTGEDNWALDTNGVVNIGYSNSTPIGFPQQLGIFALNLTSKSRNLTSTATVHNITISQTGTDIYCSSDGINYNEGDTLNVRS